MNGGGAGRTGVKWRGGERGREGEGGREGVYVCVCERERAGTVLPLQIKYVQYCTTCTTSCRKSGVGQYDTPCPAN